MTRHDQRPRRDTRWDAERTRIRCASCRVYHPASDYPLVVRRSGPRAGYAFPRALCPGCERARQREDIRARRAVARMTTATLGTPEGEG